LRSGVDVEENSVNWRKYGNKECSFLWKTPKLIRIHRRSGNLEKIAVSADFNTATYRIDRVTVKRCQFQDIQ